MSTVFQKQIPDDGIEDVLDSVLDSSLVHASVIQRYRQRSIFWYAPKTKYSCMESYSRCL